MKARGTKQERGVVPVPKTNVEDIVETDSPQAMLNFLATRGEARGLSTKAQVELQEQIGQSSKRLHDKWGDLEKKWRELERQRREAANSYGITGGGGPIVELNVGGTDMDVLREDLVRAEESVLSLVFGGRWEGRLPRDSRGRVFVDVAPAVFRKIIGFLVKLGRATPGKAMELPTLTPEEQPNFDHLVLVLGLWPHVYEGRSPKAPGAPPRVKPKDIPAPAVEPAEARKFGRQVATTFAVEEVALELAELEFQAAKEKYEREVESVAEFAGAPGGWGREGIDDDIVELNIGGTVISTRRSTLCRCPDSLLARMFDHNTEKKAPPFVRDTKGRYFVQYNDYCFTKIIEVMRMKRWPWPPTKSSFANGTTLDGMSNSRFRIFVREDEREDFGSLCTYFFPGCEGYINEAVGRAGTAGAAGAIRVAQQIASKGIMPSSGSPAPTTGSSSDPERGDRDHRDHRDRHRDDRDRDHRDRDHRDRDHRDRERPTSTSSHHGLQKRRSSGSRIDPKKLPSEISVLEIRVGLVRKVTALPRNSAHAMIAVQVHPDDKDLTEQRTVLWHFDTAPPRAGSLVVVLCNLPSIKHQGILFTAVVLCMDDDLLVPPPDSPIGELVTVKGHPPIPSKNSQAVSMIWEKVLNEELFQVGDDEVVRYEHKKVPGPLMTSKGPILCT
eukprot:g19763.t1